MGPAPAECDGGGSAGSLVTKSEAVKSHATNTTASAANKAQKRRRRIAAPPVIGPAVPRYCGAPETIPGNTAPRPESRGAQYSGEPSQNGSGGRLALNDGCAESDRHIEHLAIRPTRLMDVPLAAVGRVYISADLAHVADAQTRAEGAPHNARWRRRCGCHRSSVGGQGKRCRTRH